MIRRSRSSARGAPRAVVALLAVVGVFAAAEADAATRRFAVIVANNHSLDPGLASLSWADDDGAKYFEMFSAMGAQVSLLTVLDGAAQRRFPEATRSARAPSGATLWPTLDATFAAMRSAAADGDETVFYFVYAGHGSLGANNEGYLHLLDGKLPRRDLYARVIAASPATWNHLIIDACNAYFMVEKRGDAERVSIDMDAVRRFLRREDLRTYPNTGVILAASSESQTHEWSRWGAGVFSHELRSALLGGADVNGDGAVTYAEAAYGVEAANAEVVDSVARLRVYARPPPLRIDAPLAELDAIDAPRLELARLRGHHFVVDGRGVRILDVHPDGESARTVALLGSAPFTMTGPDGELPIPEAPRVQLAQLTLRPLQVAERGALEESYRRDLFARPYGPSFLAGALAARGADSDDWDGWYGTMAAPAPTVTQLLPSPEALQPRVVGAITAYSGAAVAGVLAGVFYHLSQQSYADYQSAQTPSAIRAARQRTEGELAGTYTFIGVGIAAALGGGLLTYLHLTAADESVTVVPAGAGVMLNWSFE